ncbi:hypothetical protein [Methylopila sp. M107]|uniref:hypothetical protein n=1 Tax=Methylopila sp. M107 TaxID=1101190 RepID=UPI00036019E6|nr:hypothetical protein [Methylopila sp. M107]
MAKRAAEGEVDRLRPGVDDVRAKIQEAIDDPRPSIPAADVFARLRAKLERPKIARDAP